MASTDNSIKLTVLKKFKHATLYSIDSHPEIALISADASYIPIDDFKEAFIEMGRMVIERKITRLIFDKRRMRVFHQPSMEWYFVDWKEQMAAHGLRQHVKILPDDEIFCQSVKIGRGLIDRKYPTAGFHKLSIRYADSLEQAVKLD